MMLRVLPGIEKFRKVKSLKQTTTGRFTGGYMPDYFLALSSHQATSRKLPFLAKKYSGT